MLDFQSPSLGFEKILHIALPFFMPVLASLSVEALVADVLQNRCSEALQRYLKKRLKHKVFL